MTADRRPTRLGGMPDEEAIEVNSIEELDEVLDRWHAELMADEDARLVTLSASPDLSLTIGLGNEESVLNWTDESDTSAPYMTTRNPDYDFNTPDDDDEEDMEFAFGNTWNQYPTRVLIPIVTAREAMREFFTTGNRPTNVDWVSSWGFKPLDQ
jgi:Immunity protein Imm1